MNNNDIKPIFIFSLPRAGSTLLQRILASNEKVSSAAEPWFLLPLFYSMRSKGIYTEYAHVDAHIALQDFINELPNGRVDYLDAINVIAKNLYRKRAHNNKDIEFFLDKTPRYHLIVNEVIETFPDARFIFLWRNPLAVASSITDTWDGKYWTNYKYYIDLYQGFNNLVESFDKHQDKVFSLKYEDLVTNPEEKVSEICAYTGLKFNKKMIDDISKTKFNGSMGDPTGTDLYSSIDQTPLIKWKKTICNPYRKEWCKQYINWIGKKRLGIMGYDKEELLKELNAIKTSGKYFIGDIVSSVYGVIYRSLEPRIFKDKIIQAYNKSKVCIHK